MSRERWSHSKLTKLTRCGEAYRREEQEREYAPPTSSMARGTAVHAVAAVGHARQIKARASEPDAPKSIVLRQSLPDEAEAGDLAATVFEAERRAGMVAPADEKDAPAPVVIGRDKDHAVRMSRFYVSRVAPFIDPLYVERKITVEPRDADITVVGRLDLGSREDDGGEAVRDLKTGKPPLANAARESQQLSLYALLRKAETGKIPDKVVLDHIIPAGKTWGNPRLVSQVSTRSEADLVAVVNRINNAVASVRAGVFLANGPGNWWCAPKWCRFWTTCSFVSHR